jgi:kynureninase
VTLTLQQFRAQFPILRTRAFLFSGALTPAAQPVADAFASWGQTWMHDPLYAYGRYQQELEELRTALGQLLGADADEIAITENTSAASNLAVRMLAATPRETVVVDDTTYPSSLYPWLSSTEKKLRYVPTDALVDPTDALAEAIDEDTVALTVTHVGDLTGRRHQLRPLAQAAHEHGASLVVDMAQSAGVVPINLRDDGVDIACGTFMKWLLGPPGVGFLYVRRELLEQLPLLDVGYEGVKVPWHDWPQLTLPAAASGARRYQLGVPSLAAVAASRVGVDLIAEVGVEAIHEQSNRLVTRCLEALTERERQVRTPSTLSARAGVIAYDEPRDREIEAFLRQRGVDIGALGFGCIRIDPHAFNNDDDVDRLIEELDNFDRQNPRQTEPSS